MGGYMYIAWYIGKRVHLSDADIDVLEHMERHKPYVVKILDYEHGTYLFVGLRLPGEAFIHPEYGLSKDMDYVCEMYSEIEHIENLPWLSHYPISGPWSHAEMLLMKDDT